jgi:hypothetical protein
MGSSGDSGLGLGLSTLNMNSSFLALPPTTLAPHQQQMTMPPSMFNMLSYNQQPQNIVAPTSSAAETLPQSNFEAQEGQE